MKYYVIQHLGYEYNDENFYRSENGGGTPEKVFTDKVAANELAEELNARQFMGLEIGSYTQEGDIEEETKQVNKILGTNFDHNNFWSLPYKMTIGQAKKIAKLFPDVKFYEVIECDGE